jgi:hypothetical protein
MGAEEDEMKEGRQLRRPCMERGMPASSAPTDPTDIRERGHKFFADFLKKSQQGQVPPEMCMAAAGMGFGLLGEIDRLRMVIDGPPDKALV